MNAPVLATEEPFRIRVGNEKDRAFIVFSWMSSFYENENGPAVRHADREHYRAEMNRVFDRLVMTARILVACDLEDENVLIGFAAATLRELHYVFVRQDFRKVGIARKLIEAFPDPIKSYTFFTHAGARRLKPRERGWKFTPRFTI